MAAKIKKGDKVVLLTGKRSDKGKQGSVNIVQRHTKPTQANPQGGIVNKEASVHVSNVAIVDPKTGEPTRVGFRMEGDRKVRFAKKSGEALNG
jgi:large subunit ribosomal protein L24